MSITVTEEHSGLFVMDLGEKWTWADIDKAFANLFIELRKRDPNGQKIDLIIYDEHHRPIPPGSPLQVIRNIMRSAPPNAGQTYIVAQTTFTRVILSAVLRVSAQMRETIILASSLKEARQMAAKRQAAVKDR